MVKSYSNIILEELHMDTNIFNVLEERGYVYQSTNLDAVKQILQSGTPVTYYLGIDPTADSLHIGHFFALMVFRYLQDAGHKGVLLIGGATALIGDPSGKSDMRKMMNKEQVNHNLEEVKTLAKRFIRTDGDNPAIIVNNADWFRGYDYVDFMRDVGVNFTVNTMLATDAYKNRLAEGGLTFLEMGYMLMQAYDFVHLNEIYGCTLQIGGSDQWANIIAGTMLYKKFKKNSLGVNSVEQDVYGMTSPLLLTKEGNKMGKTEKGTLWVARDKTTPYDFYQYFYNVDDQDVDLLLRLFTRVPLDEINQLISSDILAAKRLMAYEITKLVHGENEADSVIETTNALFGKKQEISEENIPTTKLPLSQLEEGIGVLDFLVSSTIVPTKSEGRRMVQQGGITINGEKESDIARILTVKDLQDSAILLRKGKKNYMRVTFE